MKIETNQPGVVLYTGNNLTEGLPLAGGKSKKYLGVCFETHSHSFSLVDSRFPSILLKKGEIYKKQTTNAAFVCH